LKKDTKKHGRDTPGKTWTHMVLHLSHTEGGFEVTFKDVTKDSSFYTTLGVFSQERQDLWLPKDDLKDPSSWSSSPILLRDIHSKLLSDYNWKEESSQSLVNVGTSGGLRSQNGVSHSRRLLPSPSHILRQPLFLQLDLLIDHDRFGRSSDPSLKVCVWYRYINYINVYCCLLWIDKVRPTEKTYIWVSVRWKTKN
jgi:hypothetical protein